jgi:hypothetical protein
MTTPALPSFLNAPTRLAIPGLEMDELLWQHRGDLRVAIPGVVQAFDPNTQTVTVQPAISEMIYKNLVPTPTNLPQLILVPLFMFRMGGFLLTFPVQAGDEGLIIFGDMCIDDWWQRGAPSDTTQPMPVQIERRRHDLSDGFFFPGFWNQKRLVSNYSTTVPQLRNEAGTASFSFLGDQIVVTGRNIILQTAAGDGTVVVNANLSVNGNITNTGTVDGIGVSTHVHSGVQTGGGDSGPPVP